MLKFCKSHFDILVLMVGLIIASIIRIIIPYHMVFHNGKVIFSSFDAYYQLRYADLISTHFPQASFYDPYLAASIGKTPLFNLLLASLGKVFGNLDVVAAYLPAILGILTLIPVFIIARKVFDNKWVTSFAVLFIAILPGEFLARTQLGAADYHCLEIFLTTTMMMWIVLALVANKLWLKTLYCILALTFFGLYYKAWQGSLIFVGIIGVSLYVWWALKIAQKRSSLKFSLILHGLIILAIGTAFYLIRNPSIVYYTRYLIGIFAWHLGSQTVEELPLLLTGRTSIGVNMMDLTVAWGYFGFLFFFALVGLGMIIYRVLKYKQSSETLLLVWSSIMLLLILAMRRWAYYFAINVALLSAYSVFVIGKALVFKQPVKIMGK